MRSAGRVAVPALLTVLLAGLAGRAGEAGDRLRAAASDPDPAARAAAIRALGEDAGGRRWWIVRSSLAPDRLALAPAAAEGGKWGGEEILTPVERAVGRSGFRLAVEGDEVRVHQPGREAPAVFRLSEVRRDTDGDGLTDLLEEEWGLSPLLADSDGDGEEDDGVDPFPLLPPGPVSDEDLVREAVLAFMSRFEPGVLHVRPGAMPRVQVEPGGRTRYLPEDGEGEGRLGVETLCRLEVGLDASRAEVSVMASRGRLASRWWTAFLRKAGGRWFVVATRFDGMSGDRCEKEGRPTRRTCVMLPPSLREAVADPGR